MKLKGNCEYTDFYKVISLLEKKFDASVVEKVDDFDSLYWHVSINEMAFIVCYNIYEGIDFYPEKRQTNIEAVNSVIQDVSNELRQFL